VRARAGRQARAAARQHQAPLQDVDGEREHDRAGDQRDGPSVDEPPERQDEDEEAQVAAEERIGDAERRRVDVAQHRLPVDGRAHPGRQRDQQQHDRQESADQGLDHHATRQPELVFELPDDVGRRRAGRERQVGVEKDEDGDSQRGEERSAERERLHEDVRVPDLAEPEPVGVQRHDLRDQAEGQEDEEEQQDGRRSVH
jgi:hypothetical protein